MSILISLVAGIAGTFFMTLLTELIWLIFRKPYHVVRTLSVILEKGKHARTPTPTPLYYVIGTILHYAIGVGFAYLYLFAIDARIISFSLFPALIYGVLLGIIAMAGWFIFFAVHKFPLAYVLLIYLGAIGAGHILLAAVMYYTIQLISPQPVALSIPVC